MPCGVPGSAGERGDARRGSGTPTRRNWRGGRPALEPRCEASLLAWGVCVCGGVAVVPEAPRQGAYSPRPPPADAQTRAGWPSSPGLTTAAPLPDLQGVSRAGLLPTCRGRLGCLRPQDGRGPRRDLGEGFPKPASGRGQGGGLGGRGPGGWGLGRQRRRGRSRGGRSRPRASGLCQGRSRGVISKDSSEGFPLGETGKGTFDLFLFFFTTAGVSTIISDLKAEFRKN